MSEITGYHAHVYFDADTQATAQQICEEAARLFPVQMGRMHARNVGPHARWSCQLGFAADAFDRVIPWLMLNRQGLTIFTHPETGDHLTDHRDHAFWMGEMLELDLSIFD
ncbi:DOPA 4,5-dioxygenase family protein [Rhodobacteraceae bacterium B1Z28]|uniref:DOPA 4,5-dioxygenase family protein n=1 Tax=Ruegeria haliotis TaxID=2747601 RepID=A0ABX2PTP6_9RHOB|nr:DOPA 4,5-dioxygenase family protein [Ruegeria haliotis]NVO57550.1 DOPA 4,5-dioxygenase family protein [Ruegeria haliotis]